MKLSNLAFCFIAFFITSCTWKEPPKKNVAIEKDTLNYTYKSFKQRAADCSNKADSNCTVVKFNYPVFNGQTNLNDSVIRKLISLFSKQKQNDTSFQVFAKNFFNDYQNNKQATNKAVIHTINGSAKVIRQDSSLVTLQFQSYFEDKPHTTSNTHFFNWNTKTNKKLALTDLINNNKQDSLKILAEAIFRKDEKLADNASLANDYFFKGSKFKLNNNFLVTPSGIRFLYNVYEIKPYEAGTTDLFIPYAQIKSLLRSNTVVSQYIK